MTTPNFAGSVELGEQ